ncbi:Echinoderm microtubule-associated protein-like 1 [Anabarilius grahami]|uniref:Echinoderm microtubule-associated protein-like 1 n=1 Tax=Anabarilius grahami TaxID=495550 RepID=A0A3N0YX70_ANAGA|nr:Echinoderm microtubule-associated protein-like 1 [Anabarilius grahami]
MMEAMDVLMERSDGTEAGRSPQTDGFSSECLLPPDTDFMIDERISPHSGLEVSDRLTYLEQRVQMQDDEIQLLKMAMADVLKRLNISEEQTARAPVKAAAVRPVSQRKSSSSTLPSTPSSRTCSPRTSVVSVKDTTSAKARTTGSSCRKLLEIKPKQTSASATGSRRVTHCKVTMQIFLRPLSRRTGSTETPAVVMMSKTAVEQRKAVDVRSPAFSALVQKSSCQKYKSPVKSPSQYFQICY